MAPPGRKQKGSSGTKPTHISREPVNDIIAQKRPEAAALPVELQQMILDVFRRAFPLHDQGEVKTVIQEVKGHLFQRDFASAFAKQEYLDAYALRWSAARSLGYTDIFLHRDLQPVWVGGTDPCLDMNSSPSSMRVACIGGGGGAEVAACAAAVAQTHSLSSLEVHAIDIADWSGCLDKLAHHLCTPPPLSAYASESAKSANGPLVASGQFSHCFSQCDILAVDEGRLRDLLAPVRLCTVMFTLNELFSSSISRTTAFLLAISDMMQPGSWFLVVDSPGSYSEVKLGQGQTKKYPMKWLLDHALQDVAQGKWKKQVSDDSRWFRLNSSLKYPVELENMRYQIHLYQRI
ncbi:hypothetical protein PV08_07155 [Exophiala spinifera]|uniref:25S rRNA (Uridine(2843)-N(3))-methyltransferase n=1 Tax=Exophiala spinifera TaxID=91928 RepID=A0A0D2B651_9EURO|nr:uncharacterized protein PV08_07155 [Exophiala spinifera]KIW14373.1 hypothetical protein PV08_07155 [Exophiala spinifera]